MGNDEISVKDIHEGDNVRKNVDQKKLKELAGGIESLGLLEPLVVTKREGGGFDLVAGYRRLAAMRDIMGLKSLPKNYVNVIEPAKNEAMHGRRGRNVAGNTRRRGLPPLELAAGS